MGKFAKRSKKVFKNRDQKNWTDITRENEKWETYYKLLGIIPESEWADFKKFCQEDLPTTFRVTGLRSHADEINQLFIDQHVPALKGQEFEGVSLEPKQLKFYPDGLGWQMDVKKSILRKTRQLSKTQRFMVLETDVGNISRQEAVLMIPPLLMDIKPHHYVLDMCAAPGSKTAQLVEALHASDEVANPTGFVLANDSDSKRAQMLVHQVKRLNSPNFLVVNHDAQLFPRIRLEGEAEYVKFDRVLCDVPCSGDGTMRKNVNVWKDFNLGNGLGLHTLQLNILDRGLNLLKPGGRLVYSTCSMNPIENEAVVAAALRKWGDKIRLVDVSSELPGLERRPGISSWTVYGKDMQIREPGADDVAETVFPPSKEEAEKFHLDRSIRVYPHLQNTGGFFIVVFEKIEKFTSELKRNNAEEAEVASKKQKTDDGALKDTTAPKKKKLPYTNEEPFMFLAPDNKELATCWPFYQFLDEFPKNCCLVRNSTGEAVNSIYFVAPIVRRILESPELKLKMVNAGIKMFTKQRNEGGACGWRLQNEALHTVKNMIGDDRKVTCLLPMLKYLFTEAFPKLDVIEELGIDNDFVKAAKSLDQGCAFLTVNRGEEHEKLFLPLWRGKSNVNLMVNKQDTQELLYRVFDIETNATEHGKEHAYQQRVEAAKASSEEPQA